MREVVICEPLRTAVGGYGGYGGAFRPAARRTVPGSARAA